MAELNIEWQPFPMFCSNCGNRLTGYRNSEGLIKIECGRCHSISVRKSIGRRHNRIDIYAPKGQVTIPVETEEVPFI